MNFDHPAALDWDLLEEQLSSLKQGRSIEEPVYDFHEHVRRGPRQACPGAQLLIVDGPLLFSTDRVLHLMDFMIYLETDLDLLFIRRLLRDTTERGRAVDSVCRQYLETVRPMLFEHVTQGRARADLVLATDRDSEAVLRSALAAIVERFGLGAGKLPAGSRP
jgi:uridine kinase